MISKLTLQYFFMMTLASPSNAGFDNVFCSLTVDISRTLGFQFIYEIIHPIGTMFAVIVVANILASMSAFCSKINET